MRNKQALQKDNTVRGFELGSSIDVTTTQPLCYHASSIFELNFFPYFYFRQDKKFYTNNNSLPTYVQINRKKNKNKMFDFFLHSQ